MSFSELVRRVVPAEFFSERIAEDNAVTDFLPWHDKSWRTREPGKFLSEFIVIDDHYWIAEFCFPAGKSFYTVIEGKEIWGDYQPLMDALYEYESSNDL